MDCFRPNPNDLSVRAVPKAFQIAKNLTIKCEGQFIHLCSRKGVVLQSIPLAEVHWSPCALPGGKDHCLSLQFINPQPRDVVLKAKSRRAVAQLAAILDRAARQLPAKTEPVQQHIHATAHQPANEVPEPASPASSHVTSRCTRCQEFVRLIDDHEMQTQELETVYAELSSLRADLDAAQKECSHVSSRLTAAESRADTLAEGQKAAQSRAEELETCLLEATERCEKLVEELQAAAQAADTHAASCKQLQAKLEEVEEEKKLLVAALTFAQAQLHDAQNAFQETTQQLSGASKSCSSAKTQATTARAELDVARKEAAQQAAIAERAKSELEATKAELKRAKDQAESREKWWPQERARLEEALAAAQHTAKTSHDGCYMEQARLRDEVSDLKSQLSEAQRIAQRVQVAETVALQATSEAKRAQEDGDGTRAAARREVDAFKAQAAAAEREAFAAAAELATHRAVAERAEREGRSMEKRLAEALAAQAAVVKERNALQAALEEAEVEVARARREKEMVEARFHALKQA